LDATRHRRLRLETIGYWSDISGLYTDFATRDRRSGETPCSLSGTAQNRYTANMYPPSMGYGGLDIEAISGILGSISIACWVVVFSPQIIENYSKKSADGLSIEFIIIWLGMLDLVLRNYLFHPNESDLVNHSGRLFQHGRRCPARHHAYNGMFLLH
jgi:hypothetical protein